jgi:hypothetical protein
MKPGDRKQRYQSACCQKGIIYILFGLFFLQDVPIWAFMWFVFAYLEFKDMKYGYWSKGQKYIRPSYADKHDAIDRGDLTLYKRYPHWKEV